MKHAVYVRDLSVRYGKLSILERFNLDVREGEFLVLLGPSGCGKSTLLNAIAGLQDIDDGEVWIYGENVTWADPKDRGIGMVFQSYALYPQMTVEQNLSFGLKVAGIKRQEIQSRIRRAAEILQIEPLLSRMPAQLSGGQRQRVAIGRALVRDANVFLFDEPLSNLDAKLRSDLRVEIKQLHQRLGNTIIYVTHDQIEAMTLADRIAILKGGEMQQLASPDEVYNRPANRFVAGFIGTPEMNFLDGELRSSPAGLQFATPHFAVPLDTYQSAAVLSPRENAVLGVRPEHFGIVAEGHLTGSVQLIEQTGIDATVWVDTPAGKIRVRTQARHGLTPGDRVSIGIDLEAIHLFDAASGQRL